MENTNTATPNPHHAPHRCPWWLGPLLVCGARRWLERPERLVTPVISLGDRVLEIGPGMGFFTVPMAEKVGSGGRVYCVDIQPQMLRGLERRLARRGLAPRIETRTCTATELCVDNLAGSIDVALLAYALHEVGDPNRTLGAIARALRPGGRLLLIEPKGHVSAEAFQAQLSMARENGLLPIDHSTLTPGRRHWLALFSRAPKHPLDHGLEP